MGKIAVGTRQAVVDLKEAGMRVMQISKALKLPQQSVTSILQKYKNTGTVQDAPRSGRPRSTTSRLDKRIVRSSKADPTLTAVDIADEINNSDNINISRMTVSRRLAAAGLNGRRPAKKPLISIKNKRNRMKFARQHLHWTSADWSNVLFTDESKFNLFGSDGIQYVRRPAGERFNIRYLQPTVKHGGGSVMVYGAFSRDQVGPLIKIDGIMTGQSLSEMMVNDVLPWASQNMPPGWILQQDNDPKHKSRVAMAALHQQQVTVLDWPSQSPDLNPIEHLWAVLEKRCAKQKTKNKDDKFAILEKEWKSIPQATFQKLIDSMPARCAAVIKAGGNPTKY